VLVPYVSQWLGVPPHTSEESEAVAQLIQRAQLISGAVGVLFGSVLGWVFGNQLKWALAWVFRVFNLGFDLTTNWYTRTVGLMLRVSVLVLLLYGGLLFLRLTERIASRRPASFLRRIAAICWSILQRLPDSASVGANRGVHAPALRRSPKKTKGVKHTVAVSGQIDFAECQQRPNFGSGVRDAGRNFTSAPDPELSADAIAARLETGAARCRHRWPGQHLRARPPVEGLGTSGGFKIVIEDRGNIGKDELQQTADRVVAAGNAGDQLQGLFTSFRANTPWMQLDIDSRESRDSGRAHVARCSTPCK